MERLTFPEPMVVYLNALYAGLPAEQEKAALLEHVQGIGLWLKEQTPLMVGQEEEQAANQLRCLGRELSHALSIVEFATYEGLEEICGEFCLALTQLQRLRSRLRFVDFVEFDEFMQAVVAVSQGRGRPQSALGRMQIALQLLQSLAEQISAQQEFLPPAVNDALGHGLSLVDEAILGIHAFLTGRSQDVRRPLLLLRNGCELLGYFVRWRLQQTGWNSPFADNALWCEVNALLVDLENGASPAALSGALPRLAEAGADEQRTRLMQAEAARPLWQEWDLRLRLLHTPRQASPSSSVQDMLALVEEMHGCTLDVQSGFATFLENLLVAGHGCWTASLPDSLLARELWALFPRSLEQKSLLQGLDALREYLNQSQRSSLNLGLQLLLACAEDNRQPEVVLGGLRCRCCQQTFDPDDASDRCMGHGAHQYLQVCA